MMGDKPVHWIEEFEDFFRLFEDKPNHFKYQEMISGSVENSILVIYEDLMSWKELLSERLKSDPEAALCDARDAFVNLIKLTGRKISSDDNFFVRFTTRDEKTILNVPIRNIRAKHVDKLIWFRGIITRASIVKPRLAKAKFRCMICDHEFEVLQADEQVLRWPKFCIRKECKAKAKNDFHLITKKSEFIDWQSLTVQEMPELLPPGRMPRSMGCVLLYDLVDTVKPGDRVKIMGIVKSVVQKSNPNAPNPNATLFKTFIEVNYIESEDKNSEDEDLTATEKEEITKLSKTKGIQKQIMRSIAPTICGHDNMKMACALSLFGGTRKPLTNGQIKRGDIHVLLVGDPGTAKSVLLQSVANVSPRAIYSSGKGSSGVGLTATVTKDSDTGQWTLEAGAVVLANGGMLMIDEFDKMETADRSALHEAMEQGQISIAKAGIVASLKAQTSIIAAANPHGGRYDDSKPPSQNVKLPPTLLSRFDLIFVVKDEPKIDEDEKLAEFILQMSLKENKGVSTNDPPIKKDLLKKYVRFARKTCEPYLSENAKNKIKDFYLKLRGQFKKEDSIVSILARNLDALVRLSEAHAKMALRDEVIESDVNEILELFKMYLNDTGFDEATGKIDIDKIVVGTPRTTTKKLDILMERLKQIFEENDFSALEQKSVEQVLSTEPGLDAKFVKEVLEQLKHDGTLYQPKIGFLKITNKEEE